MSKRDWLRMTPEQLRQMEAWPQWKKDYVQAVKDEKNERKCKKELAPMTKPLDQMTPWEAFCATKLECEKYPELVNPDCAYKKGQRYWMTVMGPAGDGIVFIPIYRPRPMSLSQEQINRTMCECMARLVSPHDDDLSLERKAGIAVRAAQKLAKAAAKSTTRRGPMAPCKKAGAR